MTNGYSSTAVIEHITPWWANALTAAQICSGVLAALCLAMLALGLFSGPISDTLNSLLAAGAGGETL